MQYKCQECNDTGSRDKSGDYLDCVHCDVAMQRKAMNDFLDKLPAMGDYDAAWLVHQRALAMAPKQEALAESLPEMTDDLIFQWAEGYVFTLKGMPHKMTFSRPRFVQAVRTIIAHLPTPVAAHAAANGTMTDERAAFEAYLDADNEHGLTNRETFDAEYLAFMWKGWKERAALSGAKGNA